MSIKKTYAVFGLGRYGLAVARELVENGAEVIAVDLDEAVVNSAAGELPICKCSDITDPEVIAQLGISNVDVVIVAMANSLEASVMTVTLCKELGVKTVIAKCANEIHQRILTRVGADQVVFPENESGVRLAKNLISSGFVDMLSLSENVSVVEMDVRDEWIGQNLIELNLRKNYSINVIAVRKGEVVSVDIDPEEKLCKSDKLIVIGNTQRLARLK